MTSNAQQDRGDEPRSGPSNGSNDASPSGGDGGAEAEAFAELRSILIGRELDALETLRDRIEGERFADTVGSVLPEAIELRTARDGRLTDALTPTVEGAMRESVRKDPHVLVDALFPVMGPAIRKAVAAAIAEMVQTLNRTLDNSFSVRGLKWRIEALRTGKPFAEVVLLHSLVYRVEQIFLIHTETGLLLQHVVAPGLDAPDGDLVSGMLTAIQDLVRESLNAQQGDSLDAVNMGTTRLVVERAPRAVLAAVVRGEVPSELRHSFQDALAAIHTECKDEFEAFVGDSTPFEKCRPRLEECFQARYAAEETKPSPLLVILASALVLLIVGWIAVSGWHRYKWNTYLGRLRAEPGIVVAENELGWFKDSISGLRDPLAKDPVALLNESGLDPSDVESRWEPYRSLAPEFLVERAREILGAPDTVAFSIENGILVASGTASHTWIADARRLVRNVPGVTALDASGLTDVDELNKKLDAMVIRFETNTEDLVAGQEASIQEVVAIIKKLQDTATRSGAAMRFVLLGHTDSTGDDTTNSRLSEGRAKRVYDLLQSNGVDVSGVSPKGVSTAEPVRAEATAADAAYNRSVTIRVLAEGQNP